MNKQTLAFVRTVPGWLTLHEGQFLEKAARLTKNVPGVVVEIGSYCGKSTIWLAQAGKTVVAVDPHKGVLGSGNKTRPTLVAFKKNLQRAKVDAWVTPVVATSRKSERRWTKKVSLLFIDGLHDEAHAREDFTLWAPHVARGGIVAMHDAFCGWDGAGRIALEKIASSDTFSDIGVVGSIMYGIKGQKNLFTRLNKARCRVVIRLARAVDSQKVLPRDLSIFIVHKILRLFLVNRFAVIRS